MKLNMIQPENETKDPLLSITKNCETPFNQTHRRTQETLEFNIFHPRETIHFNPSSNHGLESKWMLGLVSWVVFNSISNITEHNNKFEFYTDNFDEFSFEV